MKEIEDVITDMINGQHMKGWHLRLSLFTSPDCSLLFGHLLHSVPVKDVDNNGQQGVNCHERQPLIQVDAVEVVAEVEEGYGHDPVHQEAIYVALHAGRSDQSSASTSHQHGSRATVSLRVQGRRKSYLHVAPPHVRIQDTQKTQDGRPAAYGSDDLRLSLSVWMDSLDEMWKAVAKCS